MRGEGLLNTEILQMLRFVDIQNGPIEPSKNAVICGDSIEVVKKIASDSVDLILSDIPYGIGLDSWDVLHANTNSAYMGTSPGQQRAGSVFKKRGKPINGWSEADRLIPKQYYDWCTTWALEWLRVLRPGGSAIVFAGRRLAPRCIIALEDAGFNFRDLLGWVKPRAVHRAQRLSVVFERRKDMASADVWRGWRVGNLRPSFEPIIWCFKPYDITIVDNVLQHRLGAYNQDALESRFGDARNIIECGMGPNESGFHAAQKPLKLLMGLIEMVTVSGQIVLDPFAGSGTTVVAAKALDRKYLAIESDERMCQIIETRLAIPQQKALGL